MGRGCGSSKSAGIKSALVCELYNLLFHSSSLNALESGNHFFGDLMVRESGRVHYQIRSRFVERTAFGQQSSDSSFGIGGLQERTVLVSTNPFKNRCLVGFQPD